MASTFGIDRTIFNPDFYDAINDFDSDLPFWLDECRRAGGPVLELGCGTGRLTVPLAKEGIPILGADLSETMLEGLKRRAEREGVPARSARVDMRDFSLNETFELIFVPFNSFQCLYSIAEAEAAMACIRSHLAPSGRFILDVFNPSIELIVDRSRAGERHDPVEIPGRGKAEWLERVHYDAAAQVNRVTWTFTFPDGTEEVQRLDMRCFYPLELEVLLKASGFTIEERFGNFGREEFKSDSPKQILICRR
jgi:SAM-dependent methyltransferase